MKQLQRDLEFFATFPKAQAIRSTFLCYLVFFCFAFTLFYRSNLVHYNLEGSYGRIIEAFGVLGPMPEAFWCNRSDWATDVCRISGDVRLSTGDVRSVTLHSRLKQMRLSVPVPAVNCSERSDEVIRPYARKYENSTMQLVEPLELKCADVKTEGTSRSRLAIGTSPVASCSAKQTYSVPGLLFSSGGFCGNPFHDFREVIIPLYITAQHLNGEVVLLVSDIRPFWIERWKKVLQHLSHYPIVNIQESSGEHCFRDMTVGLYTHNRDFALTPSLMPHNETIADFQHFLKDALAPEGVEAISQVMPPVIFPTSLREGRVPKLLILVRERTRLLVNAGQVRDLGLELGFDVQVATLHKDHDLQTVYKWYHSSDVVIGAHGSELAYMTFMRRNSVLIQIVPIGTDWPSANFFGLPGADLGLHYIEYKVKPHESTLADKYGVDDRILLDPEYYTSQGWEYEFRLYLTEQSVRPDPENLREILVSARKRVLDFPPSDSLASESFPSDSLPSESLPSETLPTDSLPSESLPSETLPTESLPSESLPSETPPTESLPSESPPDS